MAKIAVRMRFLLISMEFILYFVTKLPNQLRAPLVLSTTSGFIFSLPIFYSVTSTFLSFTFCTIFYASSNNLLISPNYESFSSKSISYLIDYIVAFYIIKSFSFHSVHSLTEIAFNIKKATFIISSVVSIDHVTKSIIELSPDEPFKYLDSFFGFDSNINSNNPEL